MCQDCPTAKSRAKAAGRELAVDLLLPFIIYAIPVAALLASGAITLR